MKKQTERQFLMTLTPSELCPFRYFLRMSGLPVTLTGRCCDGKAVLQLSLCLPHYFDPMIVRQLWQEWKQDGMETDYAVLN